MVKYRKPQSNQLSNKTDHSHKINTYDQIPKYSQDNPPELLWLPANYNELLLLIVKLNPATIYFQETFKKAVTNQIKIFE